MMGAGSLGVESFYSGRQAMAKKIMKDCHGCGNKTEVNHPSTLAWCDDPGCIKKKNKHYQTVTEKRVATMAAKRAAFKAPAKRENGDTAPEAGGSARESLERNGTKYLFSSCTGCGFSFWKVFKKHSKECGACDPDSGGSLPIEKFGRDSWPEAATTSPDTEPIMAKYEFGFDSPKPREQESPRIMASDPDTEVRKEKVHAMCEEIRPFIRELHRLEAAFHSTRTELRGVISDWRLVLNFDGEDVGPEQMLEMLKFDDEAISTRRAIEVLREMPGQKRVPGNGTRVNK